MLGVTPEMAFFFILFSNCQSSVGQTKNSMGFVNNSSMPLDRQVLDRSSSVFRSTFNRDDMAVSYTHLDVYKRQPVNSASYK